MNNGQGETKQMINQSIQGAWGTMIHPGRRSGPSRGSIGPGGAAPQNHDSRAACRGRAMGENERPGASTHRHNRFRHLLLDEDVSHLNHTHTHMHAHQSTGCREVHTRAPPSHKHPPGSKTTACTSPPSTTHNTKRCTSLISPTPEQKPTHTHPSPPSPQPPSIHRPFEFGHKRVDGWVVAGALFECA